MKLTKFTPSFTACAALILLSVGVAPSANAAYTFTDLGTLGGNNSQALAINNVGQIVGISHTTGGNAHATLWNGTTPTDLGTPLGGNWSDALGINNAGHVVGVSQQATGNAHATLWNGTNVTDLGTLVRSYSYNNSGATAINDAGQIAGGSDATGGARHATLWNGTIATDLGTLGGSGSNANAINNVGSVAGVSWTTDNAASHATLWNGTTITDLGTLGGSWSAAAAINDAGQAVGESLTPGGTYHTIQYFFNNTSQFAYYLTPGSTYHATLWNGGTITDLGTLGGSNSGALDNNNAGQVVGYSQITGDAAQHATLWDGGAIIDLNSLLDAAAIGAGWELNIARGINDNGWIVGDAVNNFTSQQHGFLLSYTADPIVAAPVPEPETWAMLLAGLGLLGFTARRRKLKAELKGPGSNYYLF